MRKIPRIRISKRQIKKLLWLVLGALVVLVLITAGYIFSIIKDLPSPELLSSRQVAESTKIYDRTGKVLLYEVYGEEKRTIVPFAAIPEKLKQATIAIEDDNFYKHGALDVKSTIRALLTDVIHVRAAQGGSTITQQLAKNAFLSPEKTLTRKIKELALAFVLERRYSKNEILNLYLNQIPYGANAYGVEAASQTYFGKSSADLSLAETALLASLPKAPTYYSPWGPHKQELLNRKNSVLQKMANLGYLTEAERKAAANQEISFIKQASLISAPHFVIAVQDYLNSKYGEEFVRRAGLKVTTTLNWDLQQLAEKVVEEGVARNKELYKGTNAALVAQDAKTGQILALVGSRDYFDTEHDGNFNVATQGLRQPGSAIKPFVYLTAFKEGYTPSTVLFDLKTEFNTTDNPDDSYQPENFDEKFRGPVELKDALAQSINLPAVKLLYLAGIDNLLKLVKSFGISTLTERSRYGLSLVLGGGEVKLSELVGAYSVLSQEGVRHDQSMVLEVRDAAGNILEQYRDQSEQVIDPEYPRLINNILSDSSLRAPLFQNSLALTTFPGYDVALKTGTSNDYRDAWAIGYTPTLVAGVWAGNNDNTPMEKHAGSILAAVPIWNAFLKEALASQPQEAFTRPDDLPPPAKPVLGGQYVTTYQSGGVNYPQVHSILFYVSRRTPAGPTPINPANDPQFDNWEGPVLDWAGKNIPGFIDGKTYNQPIPPGAILVEAQANSNLEIQVVSPKNGDFIQPGALIQATILSRAPITKIEFFLNKSLIETKNGSFAAPFSYQTALPATGFNQQNEIKITATNAANEIASAETIVYH